MEHPAAAHLALGAVRRHVESARPDAPTRPEPPGPGPRIPQARHRAAGALRRLADWMEPPASALRVGE
ncbi:hypothetical protein AWW66_15565 [Micromonospora rosaria]|uniref:Uncharacterized protein n=1 Tax=Micromonospora rosaria TaxID=47874 RepID=A0A136PSA5_9ACTN|nr:hypothetical protein [Micromonospora rosaria]KXK61046.1 hypothetical protein AWW66_15565 [Micromonospora rosaria]